LAFFHGHSLIPPISITSSTVVKIFSFLPRLFVYSIGRAKELLLLIIHSNIHQENKETSKKEKNCERGKRQRQKTSAIYCDLFSFIGWWNIYEGMNFSFYFVFCILCGHPTSTMTVMLNEWIN
jgi:hypothetical protein